MKTNIRRLGLNFYFKDSKLDICTINVYHDLMQDKVEEFKINWGTRGVQDEEIVGEFIECLQEALKAVKILKKEWVGKSYNDFYNYETSLRVDSKNKKEDDLTKKGILKNSSFEDLYGKGK